MKVGIIDYKAGNIRSVSFALKRLGVDVVLSSDGNELDRTDKLILPGVGHASFAMNALEEKGLAEYLKGTKKTILGICLGMQLACIEFARNVLNYNNASSTEFDRDTQYPIISLMEEQKGLKDLGGTMRLGAYPCILKDDSITAKIYGKTGINERHRHRYEFNNRYKEEFEKSGMDIAGLSPDGDYVEVVEIKDHPYFIACQYHPEFKSRPTRPHPLFLSFVEAAIKNK